MMEYSASRCHQAVLAVLVVSALSACGSTKYYRDGMKAIDRAQYERGIAILAKGAEKYPRDTKLRMAWLNERENVADALLAQADKAFRVGQWKESEALYTRTLVIDSQNSRAALGLGHVTANKRYEALLQDASSLLDEGDIDSADMKVKRVLSEQPSHKGANAIKTKIDERRHDSVFDTPTLNTLYKGPISVEFRDTNIKMAMEVISKTSGVNFVLDSQLREDLSINIFAKDVSLEDAINLILTTYQLEKKILNDRTIIVYPKTPEKQNEYQDLVVKMVHLSNVSPQKMMELIRGFIKVNDIFVDERINVLLIRDKIETIRAIEKLVSLLDVADPEIMLELEVMEIQSSKVNDLGVKYPEQVNLSLMGKSSDGLTLDDFNDIRGSNLSVSSLSASINLKRELSSGNILANPRIRVRNREKAKIKIGDRVPVISTTQNTISNTSSDSVQYLDVGLNVDVEPDIRINGEINIKLGMEVSNVVREVRGGFGSIAYQIGTRNVETILRLKDNETQVLGGLIRDDERKVSARLPGLGDLPLLGRLFSNNHDEKQKTEIVLAITPHIIRNVERPSAEMGQFWSGTRSNFTAGHGLGAMKVLPDSAEKKK